MSFDLSDLSYTITLDDDPVIWRVIEGAVGMKTFGYDTVRGLLNDMERYRPLGVFIDVHLADEESGLEVLPRLEQAWPDAPLIVITADPEHTLVSAALAAGADDFIRKPLDGIEVRARLNARLAQLAERRGVTVLEYGDVQLDTLARTLTGPSGRRSLSSREVNLLAQLMKARGLVVAKDGLKRLLWGGMAISDNALDRKVFEVRRLLRDVTQRVELKSIYGAGLKLQLSSHDDDTLLLEDFDVFRRARRHAAHNAGGINGHAGMMEHDTTAANQLRAGNARPTTRTP